MHLSSRETGYPPIRVPKTPVTKAVHGRFQKKERAEAHNLITEPL